MSVVGAGIIGVCCALNLQAQGLRVLLLDGAGIGEGCSKGNAGHLAVEHIAPLSTAATLRQAPRMLLQANGPLTLRLRHLPRALPWLLRFALSARASKAAAATDAIASLNREAIGAYDRLHAHYDLGDLIRKEGSLLVCSSEQGFAAAREDAARLAAHRIRTEILGPAELRTFDPALSRTLAGGVFYPDAAHVVNPHRLVGRLFEVFTGLGGEFLKADVSALEAEDEGALLMSAAGAVHAKRTVVATGAWSRSFAASVGHRVPLDTERGYHLMLLDPSARPRVPTSSHEGRFVLTPMEHGVRIAGRVEIGGLKLPMKPKRAADLLPLAQGLMPELKSARQESWMGFRPTLPDSLPVIDRARRFPSVLFAFGHHHLGLTQAAVTGALIGDLIADRPSTIDLRPFRIDRFATR